jgi:hypothetical protein
MEGEGARGREGAMETAGSRRGSRMMETRGAGRVKRAGEVGSEGAGKVKTEGLDGPMAGKGSVVGGTEVLAGGVKGLPGGVSGREKGKDSGGAGCVLISSVGGGVKLLRLPIGGGGAKGGAIEKAMGEVTEAAKVIDRERQELDVAGVERRDKGNIGKVVSITGKLHLCFLVVPVVSGSRIRWDTWRSRGRPGDNNINGKVRRGAGDGTTEIGGKEVEAHVGGAGGVVGNKVAWFDGGAVA